MNQEEGITGITLTKKAEEVRAPGVLVDFPNVAEVAPSTHGVGKIEHGMGLPVIDEGSELDSKVNQEEVITGITLTKKAEEVRAPGALVDFPNVAEVAVV